MLHVLKDVVHQLNINKDCDSYGIKYEHEIELLKAWNILWVFVTCFVIAIEGNISHIYTDTGNDPLYVYQYLYKITK